MLNVYDELREALKKEIQKHHLSGQPICVRCKALSATEAIGTPEHHDYPIIKGREVMVEADFKGVKGQAFADEFENADYGVDDLLDIPLDSNRRRASFIAGLNAIFRDLRLCDTTIHCKDAEPVLCARELPEALGSRQNVLLVGHQPRFLETLAAHYQVRVVDLDQDRIGSQASGVMIEPPDMTDDAIQWSDVVFATGSTIVNGTITTFLRQPKPVIFYGVTISAAAAILNLPRFCHCGH